MSSLRMPAGLGRRLGLETAETALHHELLEEQAQSLGRAGRRVETALADLRDQPAGAARDAALKVAADAVWSFLVQREVQGLRDRSAIIAQYSIPREVLVRLGAC